MNKSVLNLILNPPNPDAKIKSKITISIKRIVSAALALLGSVAMALAQPQQPDPLMQLMILQPQIDVSSAVEALAMFDPPVICAGGSATYRVSINALKDSIAWPEQIASPARLSIRATARGELFSQAGNKLKPLTSFNHRVGAVEPGSYSIPGFAVEVYGKPVSVPAATLTVLAATAAAPPASTRLVIEPNATNVFTGQPVSMRVTMQNPSGNMIQGLTQVKINGDGFLTDNSSARQAISMQPHNGTNVAVYSYEVALIPLTTGSLEVSAQGFTGGNQFGGPLAVQLQSSPTGSPPQPVLLDSDPVTLRVNPLPSAGKLPGFTGFIGTLTSDPPVIATNMARVGDPVKMTVTFHSEGSLARFVPPPAPTAREWQTFPPSSAPTRTPNSVSYTYTLTPLTNGTRTTPRVPFSYFDPQRATYVDLTIPAVALFVTNSESVVDAEAWLLANTLSESGNNKKPALSPLATTPGRTSSTLITMQTRATFVLMLLSPLVVFGALSAWDRRRRFLEQHPDIVRRRMARRALKRERRAMEQAAARGDAMKFAARAVSAMRVACAPHFPAEPRALVGSDVLTLLDQASRNGRVGKVVRTLFAVMDESQFGRTTVEVEGLLKLRADMDRVLGELEAKL